MYNTIGELTDDNVVEQNIYVKVGDDFIHAADIINPDIRYIADRIKKANKTKAKFSMVYSKSLLQMSNDLQPSSVKIMLYLMSKMSFNNCVYDIKYADLVKGLGMSYTSVTLAFKELTKKNYIKSSGKKTNLVYHISPGVCWRGSVYNMYKKLEMFRD